MHVESERKNKRGGKPSGADAYRYLTGEAEVGGGAALLACGGAHAAVGAAGRVLPFPPLRGCLSGRLSFGATSKEKQRQCQEHKAYRWRQGVGCVLCGEQSCNDSSSVPQSWSSGACPACFKCRTDTKHQIQMNGSLWGFGRARWRADRLYQLCSGHLQHAGQDQDWRHNTKLVAKNVQNQLSNIFWFQMWRSAVFLCGIGQ